MNGYKQMWNLHGFKAMNKNPDIPKQSLAIGDDEMLSSIPLLIFTDIVPKVQKPNIPETNDIPFEDYGLPFEGDTLSLDDFETQSFDLGSPIRGEL